MKHWWKILGVIIIVYVHTAGLLMQVPRLDILNETIRNIYFHFPMWIGMVLLYSLSIYHAIRYLKKMDPESDIKSAQFAHTGTLFGVLGLLTGMLWAYFTWGDNWSFDPKQVGASITLLVYLAYFVLRGSLENGEQRARLGAVYNIFAFAAMIPLIFIIPRMQDSLHPGATGNPGFSAYDINNHMLLVMWPAFLGWGIVSYWIGTLRVRTQRLEEKILDAE